MLAYRSPFAQESHNVVIEKNKRTEKKTVTAKSANFSVVRNCLCYRLGSVSFGHYCKILCWNYWGRSKLTTEGTVFFTCSNSNIFYPNFSRCSTQCYSFTSMPTCTWGKARTPFLSPSWLGFYRCTRLQGFFTEAWALQWRLWPPCLSPLLAVRESSIALPNPGQPRSLHSHEEWNKQLRSLLGIRAPIQ